MQEGQHKALFFIELGVTIIKPCFDLFKVISKEFQASLGIR
jgi:hypothetical protein